MHNVNVFYIKQFASALPNSPRCAPRQGFAKVMRASVAKNCSAIFCHTRTHNFCEALHLREICLYFWLKPVKIVVSYIAISRFVIIDKLLSHKEKMAWNE